MKNIYFSNIYIHLPLYLQMEIKNVVKKINPKFYKIDGVKILLTENHR